MKMRFSKENKLIFHFKNARTFLFFLFFISIQIYLKAESRVDSLTTELKQTGNTPHRVDILNLLANEVLEENFELAIKYAEEALNTSIKINYRSGEFDSDYLLGRIHMNYTLNFSKATAYFTNALEHCEKNNLDQKAQIFSQLAFINKRQGNFEKAIQYYKEAYQIAESQNKDSIVSNISSYLAEIYEQTGDRNRLLFYLKKVMDIEKQNNFKNTSPIAMIAISHYYELRHQWAPAETYLVDALKIFESEHNYRWESYTNGLLSRLYLQRKNYLQAEAFANKGLAIAKQHRLSKEIADNHQFLAAIYDSLKDYKNAYAHFKSLKSIDDSIFNIEKTKEITNIQSLYEANVKSENLARTTVEKELSESQLKKTQMLLAATFIVIVLLIVLTLILNKNYRVKQAVNLQLENRDELRKLNLDEIIKKLNSEIIEHRQTKAKLEVTNAELNNFMYSSSHDLKGPLAAIKGLTNLAVADVSERERMEYIAMISRSVSKLNELIDDMVQTTKVTHGNLEVSSIDFTEFVGSIIADIKNIESSKGVNYLIEADKNLVVNTDRILFRTIMYNLIENATKYKNNSKKDPFVRVTAQKEGDRVKISVYDNGLGINEKNKTKVFEMFSRANQTLPGTGLGLYLVQKSVTKLGGEIDLHSTEGEGSEFEVTLPNLIPVQLKQQIMNG